MKSLLLKESYILEKAFKSLLKIILIISVLILVLNIDLNISMNIFILYVIYALLMGTSSITIDNLSDWDKQVNVLPVSKFQIVLSKYIVLIFFILLGIIGGSIPILLQGIFRNEFLGFNRFITAIIYAGSIGLILGSIQILIGYLIPRKFEGISYVFILFLGYPLNNIINNFTNLQISIFTGGFMIFCFILTYFGYKRKDF